ncbi:MAG TPA: outer membrane beta-barrel protein [Longimicrobiales bacterium]|nr:outer membrane beta-barrel protein [Longimicrobiales bacterium]
MKRSMLVLSALALLAPAMVHAQGISVTPMAGVYIPASDLYEIRDDAEQIFTVDKEGAFALGLNVELGMLRGSIAYATGAQLNERGVTNQENIGEGKLLAVAGDLVLRPIPRLIIVQPYLIAGAGLRREDYSYEDDGLAAALPEDKSDFALHAGIGADVMLGRLGVVAEFTDFITQDEDDKWKQHDAFAFVGLKFRVF